jgi:hypothetical protein
VYAPPFYPDVITPGGSSAEVPVQTIYFVSTTGTFDGVVGTPVVEYHTSDVRPSYRWPCPVWSTRFVINRFLTTYPTQSFFTTQGVLYSDFMAVTFVDAPDGYVADTYKSVADIMDDGATMTTTDIVLNSPIVPTDSFLQDPTTKGTNAAPIAREFARSIVVRDKFVQSNSFSFCFSSVYKLSHHGLLSRPAGSNVRI